MAAPTSIPRWSANCLRLSVVLPGLWVLFAGLTAAVVLGFLLLLQPVSKKEAKSSNVSVKCKAFFKKIPPLNLFVSLFPNGIKVLSQYQNVRYVFIK
jgi:hypothetical protein